MTIIVYNPIERRVYADQMYSFENGRSPVFTTKFIETANSVGAFTGHVGLTALVHTKASEMFRNNQTREKLDGVDAGIFCEGYVVHRDGGINYVYLDASYVTIERPFLRGVYPLALGSGADWFYAYLALGLSVNEAVQMVSEFHDKCGGIIESCNAEGEVRSETPIDVSRVLHKTAEGH